MRIGKKKRAQRESRDDQSCLGGIRYNRAQWNQAEVSRGNRERERENSRGGGQVGENLAGESRPYVLGRFIDA